MSRIEHSVILNSVEEEQEFLLNPCITQKLNDDLDAVINQINNSPLLEKINCQISRNELWQMFFNSLKATYIFKHRKQAAVIYAYKREYCKFIGLFGDSSLSSRELAAKFGIPLSECHIFDISSDSNYSELTSIKLTPIMQVPLIPFSATTYDMEILQQIGIDVDHLFLKSNVDVSLVSFGQIGEVKQFSNGVVPSDEILIESAEVIEQQYATHKAEIKKVDAMDEKVLIHGIRCVNGKLTLYDYNNDIKYQEAPYSINQFCHLEEQLFKIQHQLIQGMYVFVNGLSRFDILGLLSEATVQHYESLRKDQNLKTEQLCEERQRKNKKRNLSQKQAGQKIRATDEQNSIHNERHLNIMAENQDNNTWPEQLLDSEKIAQGICQNIFQSIDKQITHVEPSDTQENIDQQDKLIVVQKSQFSAKKLRVGSKAGFIVNCFNLDGCVFLSDKAGSNTSYSCISCPKRLVKNMNKSYNIV